MSESQPNRNASDAGSKSLTAAAFPPGSAWGRLLHGPNPFRGEGGFPLPAYSEFMPGPYVGLKPSGALDPSVMDPADPDGFAISEYQQAQQIAPGLAQIARHFASIHRQLHQGSHLFSKALLTDNPYFPASLAARVGSLDHERFLLILSLALSRTLDDKGRVRWTLFGSSDEGPARPFWQSFYTGSGRERPEAESLALLQTLLGRAHGLRFASFAELRAAGLRVLPMGDDPDFPLWGREELPAWARSLLPATDEKLGALRYLFTFRPFSRLPPDVVESYLAGRLHLMPFPGSMVFYGHQGYRKLARQLPSAMQIPLLHLFPGTHAAPFGMRVPQSGWLDEPRAHEGAVDPVPGPVTGAGAGLGSAPPSSAGPAHGATAHPHGPVVSHVKRTSRWNRTLRDEDETTVVDALDKVTSVLFSNDPERLGLYGKPMARNAQIWTSDYQLLLDGPRHGRHRLDDAARAVNLGGHFGYRFHFPPMRVGRRELVWHLPLCALVEDQSQEVYALHEGPLGYLTARGPGEERDEEPVRLWPRLQRRPWHADAATLFEKDPGHRRYQTAHNLRKLLEAHDLLGGGRLRRSYARRLLTVSKTRTLDAWLAQVEGLAADRERGTRLVSHLTSLLETADAPLPAHPETGLPRSLTLEKTATRDFEERYWAQVARLAEGEWVAKDNADFAGRADEQKHAAHDLEHLGEYLHGEYRALIEKHHMTGQAFVADHRFRWRTDFDFPWMGGWARNQTGHARERNIVLVIPGEDRSQAVIMGDHYDTAYMEDVYETARGGDLTRRAAAGADDNHSATTALLMAADVLLPLARAGKLKRDVWLVHLTGEEFPSDCLGARSLVEHVVEGSFSVLGDGAGWVDLSHTQVRGAFILDMVAHNNDHDRYVFQISHGEGAGAARLSHLAHLANERWNDSAPIWNKSPHRAAAGPSTRMPDGSHPPPVVAHPRLDGEIRPSWHFKSSLYNTDGQIFSDAGIPVVLLMENYDINRTGYHDTQDTMANIDLDYGTALVAIAIETVAEAATVEEL